MPSRTVPFANEQYYHVFNRGVAQMPIFRDLRDYRRFVRSMLYYQVKGPKPRLSLFDPQINHLDFNQKIIDFTSYCLMPTHFHFLLQQIEENGIIEFVSKLSNSYTKYFNTRYKRNGPIFQGEFKAVLIENDEQLLHLSRYIHLNPMVNYVTKDLSYYPWSSYQEYIGLVKTNNCEKTIILDQFKSVSDYKQFIADQVDYGERLEQIKHQMIDYPLD